MAKVITEYMDHIIARGGSLVSPPWLVTHDAELQTWYDPDASTHVGITVSLDEREYLVPDAVVTLSASELLARAQSIHARHPFTDPATGEPYTDAALEQAVADWITAAGA